MSKIGEIDGELHDVFQVSARRARDRPQVVEHSLDLRGDAGHDFHGLRIEPDLPRQIDRGSAAHRLRVGADGLGGVFGMDDLPGHGILRQEGSFKTYLASMLRSEEHTSELQSLAYLVCR